ncbi:hypothetical protein C8Q70DRAFT_680100 [Cubamyces menziesii]|nr:hypothetical protein C8Q70DRAFT_680100 [Cubamyces menziesii]
MDTGVIPLIHQFHGKDILSRLLQWLQLIVDYQSAFSYLHEVGIAFNECHSHDRCLPSAMLNEEGRLIVDAGDLEDANPGCFQSRLRRLYDEDAGATSPGKDYANDDVVMDCAIALQRLLKSHTGGRSADALDLKEFLGSDLAKIWASHPFQARVHHAQWGDYGYIKRDGSDESFVRLGNLYDLAKPTGKLTTFLLRRRREHDWEPAQDYPWAEDTVCHTFDLSDQSEDTVEDIAVVRTLPDDCEYHDFFWNHAEDVANEYGLNVHDIILFEEVFHYAGAVVCDTGINRATTAQSSISTGKVSGRPDRIYFHQLPLLASGEAPNPWGYWSIAADPTPGPWPPFEIPGVELTCRVQSNYARVSTFEAEVLVYLNQLRRNHILNSCSTSQDVSGRFEEIK